MSSGDAPYSLSLALPKADQYDPTETLTIRGDNFVELRSRAEQAGLDFEGIMAKLRLKQGLGATVDPTPAPATTQAPTPAATPAVSATTPSSNQSIPNLECDTCGNNMVPRNMRDKSKAFLTCPRWKAGGKGCEGGNPDSFGVKLAYDPAFDVAWTRGRAS